MNNYGNPLVTYDEIVEALRAILDCSKNNGYLDEYSFLNAKYDSLKNNPLQTEQEKCLIKAIQSLEKTIETANKVIRETLEKELIEISATNIFTIPTQYKQKEEMRKLASQDELIAKLREMSLPLEVLNQEEKEDNNVKPFEMFEEVEEIFEEITDDSEEEIAVINENTTKSKNEKDSKIDIMSMELPEISIELPIEENEEDKLEEIKEEKVEEDKIEKESIIEQPEEKKIDTSKIELIKRALEKAKEKENEQLVKILEQQLIKEIEALKS